MTENGSQHSFYSLRINPSPSGKPQEIVDETLTPVFGAAEEAWLISSDLSLDRQLTLTWGVSAFCRAGTRLNMIIFVPDDQPEVELLRRQQKQFVEVARSTTSRERLSALRWFRDQQRLTLTIFRTAAFGKSALLPSLLKDGTGVVVLTDPQQVAVMYRTTVLALRENDQVRSEINWSFGDPLRRVSRVRSELETIFACSAGLQSLATAWLGELSRQDNLKLPWRERFAEPAPTTFRLFDHQQLAIDKWMKRGHRGIFKMCTGAGKTIASLASVAALAEEMRQKNRPIPAVVVTVPTRILADQWIREIRHMGFSLILQGYDSANNWIEHLELWLGEPSLEQPRFVVATYRTFADSRFRERLVACARAGAKAVWIADEMHNLASARSATAMTTVSELFPYRLGLSATPDIEGDFAATERLLTYFGGICATYELADGIAQGVLSHYRYFPRPSYLSPDLGEKYLRLLRDIDRTSSHSPALLDLYRQSRELVRTSGVQIAAFKELLAILTSSGKRLSHTLVYCPPGYGQLNIEDSDEIDTDESTRRLLHEVVEVLRQHGITVASILGDTSEKQRELCLAKFRESTTQVICAIGCLDEGVDVPSIERAIVLYSVDRLKQFIQRRGRILRVPRGVTNKVAEIYDIVVLPHGSSMPASQSAGLLHRELRRYNEFASLADNREAAKVEIEKALEVASAFQSIPNARPI